MTRLSEADHAALRRSTETGWVEAAAHRSPAIVKPTIQAREQYCRWAAAAARFFRGDKPVRFSGSHWKL